MPEAHQGHRARMRERFLSQGLNGFAPHEVLELILFYAIPQRNVNPLAHELMNRFGSLQAVLEAPVEELTQVEGMGEYAATLLHLFHETAIVVEESRSSEKEQLRSRTAAEAHCKKLFFGKKTEQFYVICLNANLQVLHDVMIASGTLNSVSASPRLVAENVLRHSAHSVILCHNHPGGQAAPSQEDLTLTAQLMQLLSSIGVRLVDHIIVAEDRCFSFAAEGLLNGSASAAQKEKK